MMKVFVYFVFVGCMVFLFNAEQYGLLAFLLFILSVFVAIDINAEIQKQKKLKDLNDRINEWLLEEDVKNPTRES